MSATMVAPGRTARRAKTARAASLGGFACAGRPLFPIAALPHGHKCPVCGTTWCHDPAVLQTVSDADHTLAHTCPKRGCGGEDWFAKSAAELADDAPSGLADDEAALAIVYGMTGRARTGGGW